MAVPKQRHTQSRRNKRRSHHALKQKQFFYCPQCREPILPHQLCWNCGTYKGREVIDVLGKLDKKERKKKEKELAEARKVSEQKNLNIEELSKK